MRKPDTIFVEVHAFSWRRLVELRRQQLAAWQADQARQLALFELKHNCRPEAGRTVAGRYQEPSLHDLISKS
jgi:hypothetical protein